MKKVAVILCALALCACSKEWDCTITTNNVYLGDTTHSTTNTTFTGTTDEMEEFEASGTKDTPTLQQSTECH